MHVSVRERNTVTRKAIIKPAMAIVGGGCGRPATILTSLCMSTVAAPSVTTVTVSTAIGAQSVPLCGSILNDEFGMRNVEL